MKKFISFLILTSIAHFSIAQVTFTNNTPLLSNTSIVSDHAIGIADMNGDGKDDIIRVDNGTSIYYSFQEEPDAPFTLQYILDMETPETGSANLWGLCVGDMDNNGVNELIAGGFFNGIYIVSKDDDDNYMSQIIGLNDIFVQGINTFDINNDGILDIFACDDVDVSNVYLHDGSGTYTFDENILYTISDTPSDNSGNYGSCFTDIDNNGHFDLFVAKCRQGVTSPEDPRRINIAFMNDGEGNPWSSEGDARGLASGAQSWIGGFGDMDNDGDMDLIVGNHDVDSRFYINDGTGHFTDATESAGLDDVFNFLTIQGSFVDFDNDTYLDFIMTGGTDCAIAMNNGDGTFTIHYDLIDEQTNSFALGDLNHDGFVDVLTASNGYGGWGNDQADQLLINDGNENNYLAVSLVGTTSNVNGVGARITITGPWGTQIRDVKSGQSYGIQNSLTQYFGLSNYESIEQLTVTWPSGSMDTYTNIDANHFVTITEGGDLVSGIDQQAESLVHLTFYPNPTTDFIQFNSNLKYGVSEIEVFNSIGKLVFKKTVKEGELIDVNGLANGQYSFLMFSNGSEVFNGSFIKE